MRIAVGLLACLAAGAVTTALADPQTEAAPAATSAAAAPAAAATPAAAAASDAQAAEAAKKAELDRDTQHFIAEGYKAEMHGGEQLYCRKEEALGSRLHPVKNCATIAQLKLNEEAAKSSVSSAQRQQAGSSAH